jgi:hypothetical protein
MASFTSVGMTRHAAKRCVCVFVYVYMYVCMRLRREYGVIYLGGDDATPCKEVCVYVCVCVFIYVCVYGARMALFISVGMMWHAAKVCVCVFVYVCMCLCVCVRERGRRLFTHIHKYMYAYIHTCWAGFKDGGCLWRLYAYIHICIHTYIHAEQVLKMEGPDGFYMHTYIYAYIHICIPTYIHICIHTYMHTYIHTYIHTCWAGFEDGGPRWLDKRHCCAHVFRR